MPSDETDDIIQCPGCMELLAVPDRYDEIGEWYAHATGHSCFEEFAYGWEQSVYNRPAKIEAVYSDQAKVRFQDNGILDYVPLDALGVVASGE